MDTRKEAEMINTMPFNLKAEIVAVLLQDRGVPPEQMSVYYNSAFNRPFRRDIEKALVGVEEESMDLDLYLSRNGIFDLLPEGVIYEKNAPEGVETIQKLIQIHQKQKREEKEARLFFRPFENELFNLLVSLERQESSLLKSQNRQFQEFLVDFWNIKPDLSGSQKHFLLKVAPLSYSTKGNLDKICKVLQVYLKKPVVFKKDTTESIVYDKERKGELVLGRNFISGNRTENFPLVKFVIENVAECEVPEYLKGGAIYKFIEEFLEYLLPLEYELEISFKTNTELASTNFGTLGYSSVLCSSKMNTDYDS